MKTSLLGWVAVLAITGCNRTDVRSSRVTITQASMPAPPPKGAECSADDRPMPNGVVREPAGLGGCPPGMAPIATAPGRCIDRWEAHLVELSADGQEHPVSPFAHPEGKSVRAKSAPSVIPQSYIDGQSAARACELANKRLCTGEEWTAACRGTDGRAFPYGNEERLGVCNDHRARNAALGEGRGGGPSEALKDPCVNQLPDTVQPTGAKAACATPEQVYDLVGNVHEWTADRGGSFRGGFYGDTKANGRGCSYVTTAHDPTYWDYSTGFRCCSDRP